MSGWIGVDFDGTLAEYHKFGQPLGRPIPPMVERVKKWIEEGKKVKIFTARCFDENACRDSEQIRAVDEWCKLHLGHYLEITCIKDMHMIELWDDRAVTVELNTGRQIGSSRL